MCVCVCVRACVCVCVCVKAIFVWIALPLQLIKHITARHLSPGREKNELQCRQQEQGEDNLTWPIRCEQKANKMEITKTARETNSTFCRSLLISIEKYGQLGFSLLGLWPRIIEWVDTNVSENYTASIFRIEVNVVRLQWSTGEED
jgi:hypothetical protein